MRYMTKDSAETVAGMHLWEIFQKGRPNTTFTRKRHRRSQDWLGRAECNTCTQPSSNSMRNLTHVATVKVSPINF